MTACNASPLIALAQIERLELLEALFGGVIVSPAVAREVAPTLPQLPAWADVQPLTQPLASDVLAFALGAGERETISLAIEQSAERVLLDDLPARRLAITLGLQVTGTLGILLTAKREGLTGPIRPLLDGLAAHDFHASSRLFEHVLREAGEADR